ncbi:MAG: hypothetical protein EA409_04180 [Saprospirales bacterium]|nr:MAG: hypothetical protein EA409_04180 [Saprospirales bacterium]
MRISWGYKIMFLYLGFVGIILTLVFSAFNHEIQIVSDDYYEREKYQQDIIDGTFNLKRLNAQPALELTNEGLSITLPEELKGGFSKSGELWLYNIMRYQQDYKTTFTNHQEDYFIVSADKLSSGNFIIKLRWKQEDTPYYFQKRIDLP